MRFLARHDVDGIHLQERLFDTHDGAFVRDLGGFCVGTGKKVKDVLAFKIAQEAAQTGKKFNEIAVSIEIHLCVCFGDLYDRENFFGNCNAKFIHEIEPADPGLYMKNFSDLDSTIANLVLARYQNLDLFDI